jgi:hypothetical protein
MANKALNSIVGFSVGSPATTIIDLNGNVDSNNFTVTNLSNLGAVGNITITGGSNGMSLTTDGNGNLAFSNAASNITAPMPYNIPEGKSYIVPDNFQGLFAYPITIDGTLEVDGFLIDVSNAGVIDAAVGEVLYNLAGIPTGNTGFTFDSSSGNVSLPGNVLVGGNLVPGGNLVYTLGTASNRWSNLYLSGNTIYLGDSTITTDADGNMILTSASDATFTVSGNAEITTIYNGNSNISITTDGNISTSVSGTANVMVVTTTGAVVSGNITASNANLGNVATANYMAVGDLYSKRSPISVSTANTVVDSFAIAEYRSAKYTVKVGSDAGYQALEVLLIHDDANSIMTVYGSLSTTNSDLVTLTTSVVSGNVRLMATGLYANSVVNLLGTYVPD